MYIGQTTNFKRRQKEHLRKLRRGEHPNTKLQNSFNYYGEKSFNFCQIFYPNITKEELNEKEKYYILKFKSAGPQGFNLTKGGTGGDTRSKLTFEEYCFAYFGNSLYKGMMNRTGRFLQVDSSCISSIVREKAYDFYREKANKLSPVEKRKIIKEFEEIMNIKNNKPIIQKTWPNDEDILKIMCVVSTYGRGIEKTILCHFGLSKGFIFHLMTENNKKGVKERYNKMSKEEIIKIGIKYFHYWDLQKYSKFQIKQQYNNLKNRYGCEL